MNTIPLKTELPLTSTESASNVNEQQLAGTVLTQRAVDEVQSNTKSNEYATESSKNDEAEAALGMGREQLEKVAQQLQDFMGEMNHSLEFHVDEDSGRDVIKVLDKSTGDVIKQYPSEEVLSVVSKLSETAGLLVDQMA
ncbi:flagellar protein FlaG [Pseudoalteromonas sp. MMG010]|uniref:flagellar protein FlaG n=1 Tax=Pseudoalteromonas sp. MMG010 TaxID=2822685 RepID=UPI001FFCB1B1|nr:flagellar protein FlaG [Pseudoalteromonas sp. MMG010]